jgi:CRP-like cAMP-binding protein
MFNKNNTELGLLLKRMQDCTLFCDFSTGETKTLLNIAHIRDYAEGEKIFDDGTIGLCFYIIVKGSVRITSEKEGKINIIREFKEGEYFSEVHLFSESYHTVSSAAGEVTKLIVFAKPDLEDFVKIKPKLGNKVLLRFLEFFGSKMDELYKENRELKHKLKT